jgi:hypothetical protein
VKMHGAVVGLVEAWKGGGSGTSTQEVPLLLSDLGHDYGGEKRVWKVRLGITELGEVAEIGHLPILGPPRTVTRSGPRATLLRVCCGRWGTDTVGTNWWGPTPYPYHRTGR